MRADRMAEPAGPRLRLVWVNPAREGLAERVRRAFEALRAG